jgi:hypothetical protein
LWRIAIRSHRSASSRRWVAPGPGVETRRRLVEQQDLRPVEERLGQFHPPLQAPRELLDAVAHPVLQSEPGQFLADPLLQPGARQPVQVAMVEQVFADRQLSIETGRLEDDADPAADGAVADVDAGHARGARRGSQRRGEDLEQRGLAAAVRADEAEHFARTHREGDAVQRRPFAVAVSQALNVDAQLVMGRRRGDWTR